MANRDESAEEQLIDDEITSPTLRMIAKRIMRIVLDYEAGKINREKAQTLAVLHKQMISAYGLDLFRSKMRMSANKNPKRLMID